MGSLTVEQNVFLGVEPSQAGFQNRRELRRRYNELAASVGFELDGGGNAGSLRTADKQKVEILRALCRNAELIVMDEPTAALPGRTSTRCTGSSGSSRGTAPRSCSSRTSSARCSSWPTR